MRFRTQFLTVCFLITTLSILPPLQAMDQLEKEDAILLGDGSSTRLPHSFNASTPDQALVISESQSSWFDRMDTTITAGISFVLKPFVPIAKLVAKPFILFSLFSNQVESAHIHKKAHSNKIAQLLTSYDSSGYELPDYLRYPADGFTNHQGLSFLEKRESFGYSDKFKLKKPGEKKTDQERCEKKYHKCRKKGNSTKIKLCRKRLCAAEPCQGKSPCPPPVPQIRLFNTFSDESWKSQTVKLFNTDATIEQHLVKLFNDNQWGEVIGDASKITPAITALDTIRNYYQSYQNNPVEWISSVINRNVYVKKKFLTKLTAILANDKSPRAWRGELNLMEVYRFRAFVNNANLINNANYVTDDLVKARAISGTFWEVDTNGIQHAERSFSGMLVPEQAFNNAASYQVYTCMHGFNSGNTNDNIAYYFVPYGVEAEVRSNRDNYVTRRGLRVTHVRHFWPVNNTPVPNDGTNTEINDVFFNLGNVDVARIYNQRDYAVATIEVQTAPQTALTAGVNVGGTVTLPQLLNDVRDRANLGNLPEIQINLPALNRNNGQNLDTVDNTQQFNPANERLFVIGYTSHLNADLDNTGITISTTLTNEGAVDGPRRSFENNQNVQIPSYIGSRAEEATSSLATFPGISGGAVLRCRLSSQTTDKRCAVVGTVWGGERIFFNNNGKERIENFGNIINKVP
jgi:hypothetical protein